MAIEISDDSVAALQPLKLPNDAHAYGVKHEEGEITWPVFSDANSVINSDKGSINTGDIVFIASVSAGYLIITLDHGDQNREVPLRLSSFLAQSLPQDLLDEYLLKRLPDHLRRSQDRPLDIIVSVRSGTGQAQSFYDAVLQPLLQTLGIGQDHQNVVVTKDADSVKAFAQQRWARKVDHDTREMRGNGTVILLSGDGGVFDLLNNMAQPVKEEALPTIALVPLGTGNAAFHSLHTPHYQRKGWPAPSHLVLALRTLLKGKAFPLPAFDVLFSSGSHLMEGSTRSCTELSQLTGTIVASYGFHSQLVWESDTPAYRKHGDKRFGMVAQDLLNQSHAYAAVVETSSTKLDTTSFNYILATMVSNLERAFAISPQSKPLDGQLRLVYFGDLGRERTMEIMKAAYNGGSHVGMDGVGYEAVEEVKVTTLEEDARWRKVCIDGTIVELPQGGSMTVRRSLEAKLQILLVEG